MAQVYNEYIIKQGVSNMKEILITSTVAYVRPPRSVEEVRLGNYWYPAVQPIQLTDDLKKGIASCKKMSKNYAGMGATLGYPLLQELHNLPFNLFNLVYHRCTQCTSFGFSSVQAPADGYNFYGIKSNGMYVFYPPVCE